MALPTPVNGQITDAVTQTSVKVIAEAPAMALSTLYQSLAHSTGVLYENAVAAQQNSAMCAQAAANQGVLMIYGVGGMAAAATVAKISQSDVPDNMLALLTALRAVG